MTKLTKGGNEMNTTTTVKLLASGQFDVQNAAGESLLGRMGGPFHTQQAAEATARMLTAFDRVDRQIAQMNDRLRRAGGR